MRLPGVTSAVAYDVLGEPGVHIGMPSTSLTFVIPDGEPLDVGWAGGPRTRATSTLAGLHAGPAEIHHGVRQAGIQLAISPLGTRLLLGLPAAALRGEILTLADVDPLLADLPERLAALPPARRCDRLAGVLRSVAARREDDAAARAEIGRSLALLTRGVRVSEVADEVGLSRRRLQDLVRAEVGVTPKEYARLARFGRSHRLVAAGRGLADVAATCGYADQAHLTREWRALAGVSPTEWRRREFPFVQDADGPGTAG